MRRALLTLGPLIALGACAAQAPATRAPPPAPAVAQAPAMAATAGTVQPKPAGDLADTARRAGYEVRSAGGHPLYCRDETPSGTRIPTSVCLTEAEYRARQRAADDVGNSMLHSASPDRVR